MSGDVPVYSSFIPKGNDSSNSSDVPTTTRNSVDQPPSLIRISNSLCPAFPINLSQYGSSLSGPDVKFSSLSHNIFFQSGDSSPRPPRNRKPNYSETEKKIFFVLIRPHVELLDAKSQERQIMNLKTETWKEVTRKYNEIIQTLPGNYVIRDYEELRTFWKNVRRTNRRKSSQAPDGVPDFEDRLSGGEGSSVPKLEAESGSFLSCASAGSPSGIDDTDRPGLHRQNPLTAREEQSYYDEDDDTIKLKTESPAEIEIDDENIVDNTRSSSPVSRPQSPSQSGMTGPYLLKKETHCSSILDELLKDDTFTDVTLTAEGQHLKAHRIILCLSSKYFKDVLSKESATKNIIFFRDIKFEELKNIITFIYTGEVTVDASDLESFMKTAELLEVTSLCEGHKNFPKGFPISQPSEPHRIFKPTGTAKRTISNSSYSPPTKSRKTISGAETTSSPMKSRRKRSQPTALSSFVTIKTEPDVTEGEYFSECESREDQLETSNAFVDVGHLSEEELQPTTPFKDESKSDNEKDSDSLQLNDTPPVSGRCPFCPPSRQLFADATMLTHLQVSHPEETAYPCDVCYTVFTKKLSFLNHHKDCKR